MSNTLTVCLWSSHPDNGNDDCSTGLDGLCAEEAEQAFAYPVDAFGAREVECNGFVAVIGEDGAVLKVRALHSVKEMARREAADKAEAEADERAWRREIAMEQGMLHGCDAYNEAMGWDCEPCEGY